MADQFPSGFKLVKYEYLKDIPTEGWVWEFMRRNKEDRRILKSKDHPGHPLLEWGIVFNPDLTYPELLAKINEDFKRVKGEKKEDEEKTRIDSIFSVPSVNETFSLTPCTRGIQYNETGPFDYVLKFDIRYQMTEIISRFSELLRKEYSWIEAIKREEMPKEMISMWNESGTLHPGIKKTISTWIEGLPAYDLITKHRKKKDVTYRLLRNESDYWHDVKLGDIASFNTYDNLRKAGNVRYNSVKKMIEENQYKALLKGVLKDS